MVAHLAVGGAFGIESRAVEIETTGGRFVDVTSDEIVRAFEALLAEDVATMEGQIEMHEALYKIAYSGSGLNLTQSAALAFAKKLAPRMLVEDVAVAKDAASYAYSNAGLGQTSTNAAQFVEKLMALRGAKERLAAHKKAFGFAYSSSGGNMSTSAALKYANELTGIPE